MKIISISFQVPTYLLMVGYDQSIRCKTDASQKRIRLMWKHIHNPQEYLFDPLLLPHSIIYEDQYKY